MRSKPLFFAAVFLFLACQNALASFNIETDLNSIDFGYMNPTATKGDIPFQGLTVRCTSDQGNPWQLRLRLETPLRHDNNPSQVIPSENFWWYGISTTGSGTLVIDEQDFLIERVAYNAPAGEGASGIDIRLQFKLTIPSSAQSGPYSTRIILTLIE